MKLQIIGAIALIAQVCLGFTFYVLTLSGKRYTLTGESWTKVSDAELQLEQQSGVPPKQQRWIYKGRELNSDKVLGDYGIQEGSEVRMVLRLRPDQTYLGPDGFSDQQKALV
ncbi:hypothetical protein V2A60_007195 [Cordyceps javanica]|uniref:Ubiquitin family domain-containing protein n=1 Tax=Cordyceps javanica TaxID=43265 RepID=A0A545VR88_9HYPO|nr:ubiquitin family domain-containing protein [Cordyceps javanica]TQW04250.1 ubiquitin family domain-containing protein [Cordyceps javanica]